MGSPEEEAVKAIYVFYDALDEMLRGKGPAALRDVWHHTDYASTVHPFGHWARGWKEVWATWEEGAAVFATYRGHANRTDRVGGIHDLKVTVLGDAAHGTGVFKSKLYMSDRELLLAVNCTNVVHRLNGEWKLVLHHSDQAPLDWQAAIGKMVQKGHS